METRLKAHEKTQVSFLTNAFFNFLKQSKKNSKEANSPSISPIRVSKQVVQKQNCCGEYSHWPCDTEDSQCKEHVFNPP